MGKVSSIGPGTEIGKQILEEFKNWKVTGFKPWGKGVGGANHYNSSHKYKVVSASAFRSQAKKLAKIALEQMPVPDCLEDDEAQNAELEEVDNLADDERNPPLDPGKRLPSIRCDHHGKRHEGQCKEDNWQDYNEEDDGDYTSSDEENCSDDGLEGFDDIELGELQNSRAPFLSEYPSGDKLLAIFPLDGNVLDASANQFEFIDNNTAIQRLGKVPKERERSVALIGRGSEKSSILGFSDVDFVVVDAEIQKRLKANKYKRDENGDIWEVRATLQLPYKCNPLLYAKDGKVLTSFRMMTNKRGFSWGYFWLLAWKPPKPKPAKRIGGKFVKTMSKEESSIYTEKTYESNKRKV